MASRRRVAPRGRTRIALVLVGFVLVALLIVWRRAAGMEQARALRELEQGVVRLRAERAQLELDIREATSRARLEPVAERRLGLRVPAESQIVILPRSAAAP